MTRRPGWTAQAASKYQGHGQLHSRRCEGGQGTQRGAGTGGDLSTSIQGPTIRVTSQPQPLAQHFAANSLSRSEAPPPLRQGTSGPILQIRKLRLSEVT